MNALKDFFVLVRWKNLLFIALTQVLFYFGVATPVLENTQHITRELNILFWILCASSVLIAAAGYIINDYFDLNIDLVNKPTRMVVDKGISRRWAIFWHLIFSVAGILMGFYIGLQNGNWLIGIANTACVLVLWFYSTSFKKRLLIGNILISLLTGWTVMVVYFFVVFHQPQNWFERIPVDAMQKFLRLALLYGSFAFVITLVREVVKDIEDVEGDRKYGCRTMPIVWGTDFARIFASTWLVILLVLLLVVLFYVLQFGMWIAAVYNLLLIVVPAAYCFYLLSKAKTTPDYTRLSRWIKAVILTGILSMLLFKIFG
jgi:4-hydroxybenzoate polyprenyltransferase